MRNKLLLLFVVLTMAIGLVACGGDVTDSTADVNSPTATPDASGNLDQPTATPAPGGAATPTPTPNPDGDPSSVVQVLVNKLIAYDKYYISGHCGQGAVVSVAGGEETVTVSSDNGCFMVVVPVKQNTDYTLSVTAFEPGKAWSEAVSLTARGGNKGIDYVGDYGETSVIVGDSYQCFFQACIDDFTGRNVISSAAATKLTNAVKSKLADIKAKVIMVVVPDPSTVYPENVPAEYQAATETYRTQFNAAVAAGGMTVLDLTDALTAHKNDEYKIYQKTDSHWSQYGAFIGYQEIMNIIAQDFPDAAPRTLEHFSFENRWVIGGDMSYYLDIMGGDYEYWTVGERTSYDSIAKYNLLPEYTNFVKYNIPMPTNATLYWDNSNRSYFDEVSDRHTVKNNVATGDLPTAYILRDSFSNQMYDMLNERFSEVSWASLWSYGINTKTINNANPDYVIIICNERVLSDVVSQFSSSGRK